MSSGDIDDVLGPDGELSRLRASNVQLDAYLQYVDSRPVLNGDIPYGAGIAEDGQTVYLDSRLAVHLAGVDVSPALSMHEQVEWALRRFADIGVDYGTDPRGHRLANREEYKVVAGLFPDLSPAEAWEFYDEFIDPQIRRIEQAPLRYVPYDLATYPYEHDKAMMEKIENARSDRPEAESREEAANG